MRITSKGQVTIPIHVREELGLLPNTEVDFEVEGNSARLVKVTGRRARSRGLDVVLRLRNTATLKMSTDDILALTRRR